MARTNAFAALALVLLASVCSASDTFIVKPRAEANGADVALIYIQGAQIPGSGYASFFNTLQKSTDLKLWIGFPGFTADVAEPLQINSVVTKALQMLKDGGFPENAPIFFSGHSLGSVMVQDYIAGGKAPYAAGVILAGGYIQRKYLWPTLNFPIPSLTVGGEMDGLSRITRLAEAYYQQVVKRDLKEHPVVVLPGVSHFQFAGDGSAPFLVRQRDLQPEVDQVTAWNNIAAVYVDFIASRLQLPNGGSVIKQAMAKTADLVGPIIAAYEYEGGRYFNAPRQVGGPLESECVKGGCPDGSAWVPVAQNIIGADIPTWPVSSSNEYVDLGATPLTGKEFHLPVITSKPDHTISITTYVQAFWDKLDGVDTAFTYTSASELGAKLASRQCILIQGAGYANDTSFSVDDPQFCRMANEKAYAWALNNAGPVARERFEKFGQKYVFADDVPRQGGPLWLYAGLQFNEVTQADGTKVISVASPSQKTQIDYWDATFHIPRPSAIPDPGCFHYCKLLSPARAMEWIYVDSLRLERGINN
eukprot:Colp12_sorted_trinity150504_noHs@7144